MYYLIKYEHGNTISEITLDENLDNPLEMIMRLTSGGMKIVCVEKRRSI